MERSVNITVIAFACWLVASIPTWILYVLARRDSGRDLCARSLRGAAGARRKQKGDAKAGDRMTKMDMMVTPWTIRG